MFMQNPRTQGQKPDLFQAYSDKTRSWYYYIDNGIVGPTTFSDLFALPVIGCDRKPVLIRQSNQNQWYSISDINSFDTPAWREMHPHAQTERNDFLAFLNKKIAELEAIGK